MRCAWCVTRDVYRVLCVALLRRVLSVARCVSVCWVMLVAGCAVCVVVCVLCVVVCLL